MHLIMTGMNCDVLELSDCITGQFCYTTNYFSPTQHRWTIVLFLAATKHSAVWMARRQAIKVQQQQQPVLYHSFWFWRLVFHTDHWMEMSRGRQLALVWRNSFKVYACASQLGQIWHAFCISEAKRTICVHLHGPFTCTTQHAQWQLHSQHTQKITLSTPASSPNHCRAKHPALLEIGCTAKTILGMSLILPATLKLKCSKHSGTMWNFPI